MAPAAKQKTPSKEAKKDRHAPQSRGTINEGKKEVKGNIICLHL